jgi:hypothetical protein
MHERIETIVGMLKDMGYTDRYVEDHWGDNWRDRRWFDKSAPDSSILQVITGNQYTRINLTDAKSDRPFALIQYVSTEHPVFPKCGFADHTETRKTMDEIVSIIRQLATFDRQEAA